MSYSRADYERDKAARSRRPSPVTVHLSQAEARALWHLANNSADAWEDALGVLGNPQSVQAGYRAMSKLVAAGALR
jgi:hypothetical protein